MGLRDPPVGARDARDAALPRDHAGETLLAPEGRLSHGEARELLPGIVSSWAKKGDRREAFFSSVV